MARLDGRKRRLTVYDHLNPGYAKYYTREEARRLLADAGFGRGRPAPPPRLQLVRRGDPPAGRRSRGV